MSSQRRRVPPAVAIGVTVLTLAVPGCGGNGDSGGSSTGKSGAKQAAGVTQVTDRRLTMEMGEFYFKPKTLQVKAGKLRVTERNVGQVPHEFVLVRSDAAPGSLTASGGKVDESGLHSVGEIADVAAGQTKSNTFNLKRGKYIFICNLPSHYQGGMYGGLTVK